jgi:hypothetical protein
MSDSTRTGFHGLPAEYRTPDGTQEDWETTLGYLGALERSGRPIVAAIRDPRMEKSGHHVQLYQQIGFLRRLPVVEEIPAVHRFALNWPDPDQQCGVFMVDEGLFEGATLDTVDGDDYFGLGLTLGPVEIVLLDSNTNMDHALDEWSKRQHQTYLDLPTPSEVEEKWRLEPNPEVVEQTRQRLGECRAGLAERGVPVDHMSDAELEAAGNRISWTLRTSGRMSKVHHSEWVGLWLDDLAAALRSKTP